MKMNTTKCWYTVLRGLLIYHEAIKKSVEENRILYVNILEALEILTNNEKIKH